MTGAQGVGPERGVQGLSALPPDFARGAVVDRGGGVQRDSGVPVLVTRRRTARRTHGASARDPKLVRNAGAYLNAMNAAAL